MGGSGTIVPQVVHCPAVFDDKKRDPLAVMLDEEYRRSDNQCSRFDDPKNHIEQLFVTRVDFIVGDIPQESHQHGLSSYGP
jgi:hypothetical protein